jgi:hypothetical protein
MTTDEADLIRRGRAAVRMIESAEVLLAAADGPFERVTFGEACDLARQKLRQLVADLDPSVTAQIMMASEKIIGTAGDVGLN